MSLQKETCNYLNVAINNTNETSEYKDSNSTGNISNYSNKSHTYNYDNYTTATNIAYPNQNDGFYTHEEINNILNEINTSGTGYNPRIRSVDITKEMIIGMNARMKIKDVEILVPNKVVQVTFDDNAIEKSVCHEADEFNLETAIMVCIAKHLLGSSAKFNNLVSKALKLYNNKIEAQEKVKEEETRIEAKRKKKHEKLMKRIAKREKEAREARINEMAEAIRRADMMKHTEGM